MIRAQLKRTPIILLWLPLLVCAEIDGILPEECFPEPEPPIIDTGNTDPPPVATLYDAWVETEWAQMEETCIQRRGNHTSRFLIQRRPLRPSPGNTWRPSLMDF